MWAKKKKKGKKEKMLDQVLRQTTFISATSLTVNLSVSLVRALMNNFPPQCQRCKKFYKSCLQ